MHSRRKAVKHEFILRTSSGCSCTSADVNSSNSVKRSNSGKEVGWGWGGGLFTTPIYDSWGRCHVASSLKQTKGCFQLNKPPRKDCRSLTASVFWLGASCSPAALWVILEQFAGGKFGNSYKIGLLCPYCACRWASEDSAGNRGNI